MKICLIVAMTDERVIGKEGTLPWHLSEDLKRFKQITMGSPILMGRKTHESIGRVLPGRENIVISSNSNFQSAGATVVGSLEAALERAKLSKRNSCFVIGGSQIYEQALDKVDRIYLTLIHHPFVGDTHFPDFNLDESFHILEKTKFPKDDQRNFDYTYIVAERRAANHARAH